MPCSDPVSEGNTENRIIGEETCALEGSNPLQRPRATIQVQSGGLNMSVVTSRAGHIARCQNVPGRTPGGFMGPSKESEVHERITESPKTTPNKSQMMWFPIASIASAVIDPILKPFSPFQTPSYQEINDTWSPKIRKKKKQKTQQLFGTQLWVLVFFMRFFALDGELS